MDEASQNSFYEDDLPVSGTITEVLSHLKDEGLFTFKSTCQQLKEETAEPIRNEQRANDASDFTVPVCDDQICQLEIQQRDIDHTTSMSNSLPREHRTVPSIEMCGERPSMADNFKNLEIISKECQYFAECAALFSPPDKNVYDCFKSSKDDKGKLEASRDELYIDWNAPSQFELLNKVPAGWPAIGVKSFVTESKNTPHQSTLSFFTMVKQAHLLSEEQLQQMKEPEHNEHFDQCSRSILKRSSPSLEAVGSPAEKFTKTDLDIEIENPSEDGEFFSQQETINDSKDASHIIDDQEVPIQEVNSNSTGQAMGVVDEQMSGNSVSRVSSIGERPSFNSESNSLNWQSSTEDHFHIEKAPFYEEPNIEGPCTESVCLKFSQKDHGNLSPDNEGSFAYGAAKTSSMNAKPGGGKLLLADQLGKNSELLEKQQIMIITNEEEASHNEVQMVLSQSSITYNIACKYPPLPEKVPNEIGLCSSLGAIDERAVITDPLDDVDCSPLQPRKDLLQAEILLYEREEVDEWVHCDAFPPNTATSQDLESFSSSIPMKNLSDRSPWHTDCFGKVRLSECFDKLINEQPASPTEKAPNPMSNVCLAEIEDNPFNGVAADSKNRPLQATRDETLPENMQTEGPTNQGEMEITTNFPGQRNDDINAIALPDNGSLMDNDDDKENKRKFNYVNQDNIKLGESSEMKDKKKTNNSHQDKSDQFRTEVESKMIDLDGPELLQFAMIFVQGALKKSQIVPSCNETLKRDEDNKCMSMATPAFLWKSAISYHSQQAPVLGPTIDEASNAPGSKVNENDENRDADNREGPSHLIRPLPKTSCNRPLRLGLSRKHSNKRLHPYLKKHSNEKPS